MKHRSRTGTGPTAASAYSRQVARFFLSRAWLDRPLPVAVPPVRVTLTICLGETTRKEGA